MGEWMTRAFAALEAEAPANRSGVEGLRAGLYRDGRIDGAEAARLIDMHRSGEGPALGPCWEAFLVEALIDHYALQREAAADGAPAILGELEADGLIAGFEASGGAHLDAVEVRLLTALYGRLVRLPARMHAFARRALVETIAADGALGVEEAAFARAVLHGPASEAGIRLTAEEEAIVARLDGLDGAALHAAE
jgi:2-hydroxychromene-2-carboxylate isomerase